MNNIDGYGRSGKVAWPPLTLSKQTALTGLFSNNPLFATASYGTTIQPFIVPDNCQLQVNFTFLILTPLPDGKILLQINQEQVTSITNIGYNSSPTSQSLIQNIQNLYGVNGSVTIPITLKFYYQGQQYTLKGKLLWESTNNSKRIVHPVPSILFPPVIPLFSENDPFIILGAEIFYPEDTSGLGNDPIIINQGVLYLC